MQLLLRIGEFLWAHGAWGLTFVAICVIVLLIVDEDRTAIWRARLYKAIFQITGQTQAEKRYISNDIKGRLNKARRSHYFGKALLPRAVDIVWVEGGAGAINEIREGEFVVRLDPSREQEKNIALLASSIVKRTTLVGIRHSVEASLQLAIDLNLIKCLLAQIRNKGALDYFFSYEYTPQLGGNAAAKGWNDQITILDERGMFTRILLVELEDFAKRVHGMPPRLFMAGEVEGLVTFLHRIATKQFGQLVPLEFQKAYIRVGIIIVATTYKLLRSVEPYVKAMNVLLNKDFFSIYMIAFDKEWLGEADPQSYDMFQQQLTQLSTEFDKGTMAIKEFDVEYYCIDQDGNRRKARCARYRAPNAKIF
jgi:hypothetical protein